MKTYKEFKTNLQPIATIATQITKYENDFSGLLQSDLYYRLAEDANMNLKAEETFISEKIDLVANYIISLKANWIHGSVSWRCLRFGRCGTWPSWN